MILPLRSLKLSFVVLALAVSWPYVAAAQDCTDPSGNAGDIIYNSSYDVYQGCTLGSNWFAFHQPRCSNGSGCVDPCTRTSTPPTIGETCDDGSIYAGLSPDSDVRMYTTPADAASIYTWNDGSGGDNSTDTSMTNCTDDSPGTAATCQTGEANTDFLVGATGLSDYPFAAAGYCNGLSAHGYNDWYLPAQDELDVLYTNKNAGDLNGTFNETGSSEGWYWSSSEYSEGRARPQRFSDGAQSSDSKDNEFIVRCVRR